MSPDREDNPLVLDNPDETSRLRDALDRAGYAPEQIAAQLQVNPQELASFRVAAKNHAVLVRRTQGTAPLDSLIRLFLLGVTVDLETARRALAPSNPEHWIAAGLLQQRDGGVAALLQLTPFEHLIVAIDPLWSTDISASHVLGIGWPSFFLAQMTVRRPSRSTLDVGAGCGIQAFLAAPHSGRVIGVDRNRRAVNVAAFNAQLNRLSNTTFLEGDLYSPVHDQRFELIVANPPYVISPESRFVFRDSGLKGDEISRRVVREGAGLLEEGAYLQLICEWAHLAGQDWRARLAGWFENTGCDACVLRFTTVDPLKHAEVWLKPGPHDPPEVLPERLNAWLDYHQREGIEAVSDGVISLRKRSGASNWIRFDDAPQRVGPCGASVGRAFAAADFLQAHCTNEALLAAKLRVAPDVCLEQQLMPAGDGWQPRKTQLSVLAGLAYRDEVNQQGLALVDRCRGQKTVRGILESLPPPGNGQPLDVALVLSVVRRLVEQGLLLPA
jgi:methylase of polypeptide subunit release factors